MVATPKSTDSSAVQFWKAPSGMVVYEFLTPNHFNSLQLANGVVEKPNCRMVIYGDDVDNLLYYGCHLFTDFSVSDWRNVFGVEIEVGFKDEND